MVSRWRVIRPFVLSATRSHFHRNVFTCENFAPAASRSYPAMRTPSTAVRKFLTSAGTLCVVSRGCVRRTTDTRTASQRRLRRHSETENNGTETRSRRCSDAAARNSTRTTVAERDATRRTRTNAGTSVKFTEPVTSSVDGSEYTEDVSCRPRNRKHADRIFFFVFVLFFFRFFLLFFFLFFFGAFFHATSRASAVSFGAKK